MLTDMGAETVTFKSSFENWRLMPGFTHICKGSAQVGLSTAGMTAVQAGIRVMRSQA